jgi:hypothetical protein
MSDQAISSMDLEFGCGGGGAKEVSERTSDRLSALPLRVTVQRDDPHLSLYDAHLPMTNRHLIGISTDLY